MNEMQRNAQQQSMGLQQVKPVKRTRNSSIFLADGALSCWRNEPDDEPAASSPRSKYFWSSCHGKSLGTKVIKANILVNH